MAWYDYPHLNNYRDQYSFASYPVNGLDIPMPAFTPVSAVWSGTVSKRYCDAGGCQIIIKIDDTSKSKGIEYYNFRHLDLIDNNIQEGTRVSEGQRVGQSGGQNTGGNHPSAPNYSSGPHLGIGVSHSNFIPYTLETLTPDLNPSFMLDYARTGKIGVTTLAAKPCECPEGYIAMGNGLTGYICVDPKTSKIVDCAVGTGQKEGYQNPLDQIASFLSSLSELQKWLSDPIRILKVTIGIVLIGGSLFLLLNPQSQVVRNIGKAAKRI